MNEKKIELAGRSLSLENVAEIACQYALVDFSEATKNTLRQQRQRLNKQLEKTEVPIYGTNRLHGDLKDVPVDEDVLKEYQVKYLNVHNCGTGDPLAIHYVRAMMVIRLNSFAKGLSGIRMETCQCMIDMLNRRVTPVVLEEGSVGASGDLVPLAMIGGTMIGLELAEAYFEAPDPNNNGEFLAAQRMPGTQAMEAAGIATVQLEAKEAMGLTNGSNFMAGIAALECLKSERLLKAASIVSALTVEAIRGEHKAFGDIINNRSDRNTHQLAIAIEVRSLLKDSRRSTKAAQELHFSWSDERQTELITRLKSSLVDEQHVSAFIQVLKIAESKTDPQARAGIVRQVVEQTKKLLIRVDPADQNSKQQLPSEAIENPDLFAKVLIDIAMANRPTERVQDRYSVRAVPQVNGTAHRALHHFRETLEGEINSATDNPLFDFENTAEDENLRFASGANFHGQPIAAVVDYVKIALTATGLLSDKRSFSILSKRLSYGLPDALAFDSSEADGGLMITQYAGAARAADNRVLSTPASVMSVSTSANQEDFVSMGSIGVLNLCKVNTNLARILGIELLCSLRALQLTYEWLPRELRQLGVGTQRVYELLSSDEHFPQGDVDNPVRYLRDHFLGEDLAKAEKIVDSDLLINCIADLWN